jgi:hypothetical protein
MNISFSFYRRNFGYNFTEESSRFMVSCIFLCMNYAYVGLQFFPIILFRCSLFIAYCILHIELNMYVIFLFHVLVLVFLLTT